MAEKQGSDTKRDQQKAAPKKQRVTKLAAPPQLQDQPSPELVQLALADPAAVAPSVILALQRSHGNQTVQRLIAQSQAAKEAEVAEAAAKAAQLAEPAPVLTQVQHTVVRRPKLSTPAPVESAPPMPELSETAELESLSLGWQAVEDYVPPIAPPALPPEDNNNPRNKIGSPFRHLDGFSNRKARNKHRLGPATDWADYVEKNALAFKYAEEAKDLPTASEAGAGGKAHKKQ